MTNWNQSLLELIRRTSAEIPNDVLRAIRCSRAAERRNSLAEKSLRIIEQNIEMARHSSLPICQDTGSILFFVRGPVGLGQRAFEKAARAAVLAATRKGYLRQNSVDSLTGRNDGTNLGAGTLQFHFEQHARPSIEVRLVLKGGGCENMGAQYALPSDRLRAGRNLEGCRRAILDTVVEAQGKGCAPGVLGVCIGGDRVSGGFHAKEQFLRKLDDHNPNRSLDRLERQIVRTSNSLGIGPMGFGGRTTLLGCKIGVLNRVPASYFVTVSYMCWAFRRQGVVLERNGSIVRWLY
jgi:fumarate hydratase class I